MEEKARRHITNRQIVTELRHRSRAGYRHLCDRFQGRLLREAVSAYRIPRPEAEEIVNDTLLAVSGRIERFQFRGSDDDFRLWVMTILRNRVRDHLRKSLQTSKLVQPITDLMGSVDQITEDHPQEILVSITRGRNWRRVDGKTDEMMAQLIAALDDLEQWERTLLRCRAIGVPYGEIAHLTGKSSRQLKVYHARVQRKLRKALGLLEAAESRTR